MFVRVVCIFALLFLAGCSDSYWGQMTGYGSSYTVELYSGGVLVRKWTSSGKVESQSNSDGYYFIDRETGKLVEISGDIVITTID